MWPPTAKLLEIKHLRVSKRHGFIKSQANILNEQFKSVFTNEDLSSMTDTGVSHFGSMQNINIEQDCSRIRLTQGERGERSSKQLPPSVTHVHHLQGTGAYCPRYHHKALQQNNVLCNSQHGFRCSRSCESQLVVHCQPTCCRSPSICNFA